jgi:hypothetical protein
MAARGRSTILSATVLIAACNSIFGIHEGPPRPICVGTDDAVEPMIDDMEDGDGFICESKTRHGHWYTFSDGTSTDLTPPGDFDPTLIPGGRGTSRYAARLAGSGFTEWGAGMGFNLNLKDLSRQPYDATTVDGIKFWMKSTAPVLVAFPTPQTDQPSIGGQCEDTPTQRNCGNPFAFQITAPGSGWVEYQVPFAALAQPGGNVTWDPRNLFGIEFHLPSGPAFDVWVDDLRFYRCPASGCLPTCTDPAFPVPCRAMADAHAICLPAGMSCDLGCDLSNTVAAPADGRITTFDGTPGALDITEVYPGIIGGPAESAPTVTTNGALHIKVNAPVTSTSQILLADFSFLKCVDAAAFQGVQFSVSGAVSGCAFDLAVQDSAHAHYDGVSPSSDRHGTGAPGSYPAASAVTADQLTSEAQTVMIPFAGLMGGSPATPTDPSKLMWLDWVFGVDPHTDGGPAACTADVVVDDVRFY